MKTDLVGKTKENRIRHYGFVITYVVMCRNRNRNDKRVSWLRRLGGDAEIGEFVWYFSLLVERITTCDLCV